MDAYTTTTRRSWFDTFASSLGGLFLGPVIFIAAIIGLYFIEGQTNYAKLAHNAPIIQASQQPSDHPSAPLVAVTGTASLTETLGDSKYLVPGKYLAFTRTTEMYAWHETKHTEQAKDSEGNTVDKTTTSYKTVWTSMPQSSSQFEHPEGHQNPEPSSQPQEFGTQKYFKLGAYTVTTANLELPEQETLHLSEANVTVASPAKRIDDMIYVFTKPESSPQNPQVGDSRTFYTVLMPDQKNVTVFGSIQGPRIEAAHLNEVNSHFDASKTFKRLFMGSPREATEEMEAEYRKSLNSGRLMAFLGMLVGTLFFLSPFSTLFSFIPILGGLAAAAVLTASLVVSSVCFVIALTLFDLFLAPLYVLAILGALVGALIWFLRGRKATEAP